MGNRVPPAWCLRFSPASSAPVRCLEDSDGSLEIGQMNRYKPPQSSFSERAIRFCCFDCVSIAMWRKLRLTKQ
jgi:hypothetical protein